MSELTVIDVCREMGIEPYPELTWAVGGALQAEWNRWFGMQPPKVLRKKTYGPGSHCFAAYPENWRDKIMKAILALETERAKQGDLFA